MKYNELINQQYAYNLLHHTFHTRTKNRQIFDYFQNTKQEYEYIQNEFNKIMDLAIPQKEKEKRKQELIDEEIPDSTRIRKFHLSDHDFDEDFCKFPNDIRLCFNEIEIKSIIDWCSKK